MGFVRCYTLIRVVLILWGASDGVKEVVSPAVGGLPNANVPSALRPPCMVESGVAQVNGCSQGVEAQGGSGLTNTNTSPMPLPPPFPPLVAYCGGVGGGHTPPQEPPPTLPQPLTPMKMYTRGAGTMEGPARSVNARQAGFWQLCRTKRRSRAMGKRLLLAGTGGQRAQQLMYFESAQLRVTVPTN